MKAKEVKSIKGAAHWLCPTCGELKPSTSYYLDSRTANGLKGQCKPCHIEGSVRTRDKINTRRLGRESMRRQRKADPEKFKLRDRVASRSRDKTTPAYKARIKLNNAVASGKIVKPNKCEACGCGHKLTAHHEDYSKPLTVEWLCYECHGKRHWKD